MKKEDRRFTIKEVLIIVILSSFFMFFLGGISIYRHLGGINYTLLGNDKELKKFISTYDNLLNNYYGNFDKSTLISGAINGMYASLDDPYTTYLDANNTENINNTLNGQYIGIGIILEDSDNGVQIKDVVKDSPALKAGLIPGDIIIKLNNMDVSSLYSIDISEMIKATTGDIKLEIIRNKDIKKVTLRKEDLAVPIVKKELITYKEKFIGYISLEIFNDTADIQFEDAIFDLEKNNIESLIIDLRDNTGGYLEVTKNIAELFLKKGKIIYTLVNNKEKVKIADITNESRNYKIVVLVNSNTASSAEILAASLKYSYGAIIIGNKTYGKGKVQKKTDLIDGTSIKYTIAKWLMPNGKCIDGVGIIPDFEVTFDKDTIVKDDIFSDNQILYALDILAD